MIRFGPSGNSIAFYDEGYKHTYEAMKWVADMGLNAYEYSFGRGVRIKEESANKIADEAEKYGIALSVHAPYFINLASDDEEKFEKNVNYFADASKAATWMRAKRVIFHPGSCAKIDRTQAFEWTKANLKRMLCRMDELGYTDLHYCPETMGKINQVGDLNEVIELCKVDERLIPTIDFGHLHTRGIGAINTADDFEKILVSLIDGLGKERVKHFHVHFSKIAYTGMGEKMHVTFDDEGYGPDFSLLAPLLKKYGLEPNIVCESNGTMAKDAKTMKEMYEKA